jgi:hypothetical protein
VDVIFYTKNTLYANLRTDSKRAGTVAIAGDRILRRMRIFLRRLGAGVCASRSIASRELPVWCGTPARVQNKYSAPRELNSATLCVYIYTLVSVHVQRTKIKLIYFEFYLSLVELIL